MIKRLTKSAGVVLVLLFIGGAILLPAFHRAHCTAKHATHEAGNCAICQLANRPAITTPSTIVPIVESLVLDHVVLPVSTFSAPSLREATQARAPPVA